MEDDMFFWEGGNVEPYKYKESLRYKQDRQLLLGFIKYMDIEISSEFVNYFLKKHYEGEGRFN
jgi:hypothetical protein